MTRRNPWLPLLAIALPFAALAAGLLAVGAPQAAPQAAAEAADHTALLQGWLDAVCRLDGLHGPAGGTLRIPPGEYHTADTLTLRNVSGLRVTGDYWATRVVYDGPPGRPVIELANCRDCELSWLVLLTATKDTAAAVRVTNVGPGDPRPSWDSSSNDFTRLFAGAYPGTPGDYRVCYDLDSTARGGDDSTNDFPAFTRCTAGDYSYAGWRVNGANLHGTRLVGCQALGYGKGRYGVACDYGSFLSVEGGYMNGHEADVAALDFQMTVRLVYVRSENSRRFLVCGGPTGAPLPVTVENCVWDGKPVKGEYVLDIKNPGPVGVRANTLRSANGNPPRVRLWGLSPVSAELRSHFAGAVWDRPVIDHSPGSVATTGTLYQSPDGSVSLTPAGPGPGVEKKDGSNPTRPRP